MTRGAFESRRGIKPTSSLPAISIPRPSASARTRSNTRWSGVISKSTRLTETCTWPRDFSFQPDGLYRRQTAGRLANCASDGACSCEVLRVQVDVPRHQESARAHDADAGSGMAAATEIRIAGETRASAKFPNEPAPGGARPLHREIRERRARGRFARRRHWRW